MEPGSSLVTEASTRHSFTFCFLELSFDKQLSLRAKVNEFYSRLTSIGALIFMYFSDSVDSKLNAFLRYLDADAYSVKRQTVNGGFANYLRRKGAAGKNIDSLFYRDLGKWQKQLQQTTADSLGNALVKAMEIEMENEYREIESSVR